MKTLCSHFGATYHREEGFVKGKIRNCRNSCWKDENVDFSEGSERRGLTSSYEDAKQGTR